MQSTGASREGGPKGGGRLGRWPVMSREDLDEGLVVQDEALGVGDQDGDAHRVERGRPAGGTPPRTAEEAMPLLRGKGCELEHGAAPRMPDVAVGFVTVRLWGLDRGRGWGRLGTGWPDGRLGVW